MKKKIVSLTLVIVMVMTLGLAAASCSGQGDSSSDYVKVSHRFDKVFDTQVYTEVDEEFANEQIDNKFDLYFDGGGCTAFGKTTEYDGLVIGRNMDLYITKRPSYIVRTDVPGRKKTFGLTYSHMMGEDADVVLEKGVNADFYKMIPFLETDVMNEDGFYIEINMRNADYDENGNSIFSCTGTNPGKERMSSFLLPYYLGSRCSTVDEAVKIAQEELDLYTPEPTKSGMDWNFCFLMADATGKFGIMEIAKNKVVFNEAVEDGYEMPNGACQANYYITPEFQKDEKMKCGVGRVQFLKDRYNLAVDEVSMFTLMMGISYFQSYLPTCQFDNRSEFIGINEEDGKMYIGTETPDVVDGEKVVWDYDYVTNPDNKIYIDRYLEWLEGKLTQRNAEGSIEELSAYWESTFTLTATPAKGTMFVRFNENNKNVYYFDFDNWDKDVAVIEAACNE